MKDTYEPSEYLDVIINHVTSTLDHLSKEEKMRVLAALRQVVVTDHLLWQALQSTSNVADKLDDVLKDQPKDPEE